MIHVYLISQGGREFLVALLSHKSALILIQRVACIHYSLCVCIRCCFSWMCLALWLNSLSHCKVLSSIFSTPHHKHSNSTNINTIVTHLDCMVSLYGLCRFNLVVYSSSVRVWRDDFASPTEESVGSAVQWLSGEVRPGGCSCLLQALKVGLQ